jgi:hypothetical protein
MLEAKPQYINTTILAERWQCCTRTVLRICREHGLEEIRFRRRGRINFRVCDVETLETAVVLRRPAS